VLPDAPFDDVGDVLQRRGKVFQPMQGRFWC
jgi:hypothetical protein